MTLVDVGSLLANRKGISSTEDTGPFLAGVGEVPWLLRVPAVFHGEELDDHPRRARVALPFSSEEAAEKDRSKVLARPGFVR